MCWAWLRRSEQSAADADPRLPLPTEAAEDWFVSQWRDDGGSKETLAVAVCAAVDARRWLLAARLASLLPPTEGEDARIERARAASRFRVAQALGGGARDSAAERAEMERRMQRDRMVRMRTRDSGAPSTRPWTRGGRRV